MRVNKQDGQENAMRFLTCFAAFCLAFVLPDAAQAYIGPGAGLSAIGSVLAFLGVVVLLVAGFVWYPVKRFLRAFRGPRPDAEGDEKPDGPAT
jgi:hypothetical protein